MAENSPLSQLLTQVVTAIASGRDIPTGVVDLLDGHHALLVARQRMQGRAVFHRRQPATSGYLSGALEAVIQAHCGELVGLAHDARAATLAELVRQQILADFEALTATQRQPAEQQPEPTQPEQPATVENSTNGGHSEPTEPPPPTQPAGVVRVYPDIAAATLKAGVAPLYRVYLLARAADPAGRGVLTRDELHQATAGIIGRRRLRQLIAAGVGRFWRTKGAYVGLYSPARIAQALDVDRLTGHPVAVSVTDLVGGIGAFRAALLAAWHSGRGNADGVANPISRQKLVEITGVSASSQRNYERTAGIVTRVNYAIGAELGTAAAEDAAYQHDTFVYTDWRGKFGERQAQYLSWRLPNSYQAELSRLPRGRQRRINGQLASCYVGLGSDCELTRVFWHNSKQAHDGYLSAAGNLQPDATRAVKLVGVGFWTPIPKVSG